MRLPPVLEAKRDGFVAIGDLRPYVEPLTGVMRRVWTFLATLNDIPVEFRQSRSSPRGFFGAKAKRDGFLDHNTITLKVPVKEAVEKLKGTAVAAAAAAAKRRAHPVRGHWRKDWRHPGARIWIKEHQRGDASIGFVTHDYKFTH